MPEGERHLTSPGLRAMLFYSSAGKCALCKERLGVGWHADHVIPWKVSHRTNVHEMQALCASCNLRKGARVMQGGVYFEIDTSAMRPGQRQAVDTIVKRIHQKRSHTAVVLPTRYGKTDVMRVSGLFLLRDRLVSHALMVEPNKVLRDQAVRKDKCEEALARYGIRFPGGLPVYSVDRPPTVPFPPHPAIFTAITTQMLNFHKVFFTQWVENEIRENGVPPVIYIDEAHTGSETNQWGDSVEVLSEAGGLRHPSNRNSIQG